MYTVEFEQDVHPRAPPSENNGREKKKTRKSKGQITQTGSPLSYPGCQRILAGSLQFWPREAGSKPSPTSFPGPFFPQALGTRLSPALPTRLPLAVTARVVGCRERGTSGTQGTPEQASKALFFSPRADSIGERLSPQLRDGLVIASYPCFVPPSTQWNVCAVVLFISELIFRTPRKQLTMKWFAIKI